MGIDLLIYRAPADRDLFAARRLRDAGQRREPRHAAGGARAPEQYRDLLVRVAGYSDTFTKLSPKMQEEVIARTGHEMVVVGPCPVSCLENPN